MNAASLAPRRHLAVLILLMLAVALSVPSIAVAEGGVAIWLLSDSDTGGHLYAASATEWDTASRSGWSYEEVGWHGLR